MIVKSPNSVGASGFKGICSDQVSDEFQIAVSLIRRSWAFLCCSGYSRFNHANHNRSLLNSRVGFRKPIKLPYRA
jgi:hypothetical protein